MPPGFQRWARIFAINAATVGLLLVAAELTMRAFSSPPPTAEYYAQLLGQVRSFWEPCADVTMRDGGEYLVGRHAGYTGGDFVVAREKPAGVLRVAIVGESTAAIVGGALHDLLQRRGSSESVQVLNCASTGSGFEHAQARAQEVLSYDPDVLIVEFGHNLAMHFPVSVWHLRVLDVLARSRLASWFVKPDPGRLQTTASDTSRRLERFGSWLETLSTEAKSRGIETIVATMTPNVWLPPVAHPGSHDVTEFLSVKFSYHRGETEDAVRQLRVLVQNRPNAYWGFTLAVWLARSGQVREAREHFLASIDQDVTNPDRVVSGLNGLVRQLADEGFFELRDTQADVEAEADHGLVGWNLMLDNCHPRQRVMEWQANRLLAQARRRLGQSTVGDDRIVVAASNRLDRKAAMRRTMDGVFRYFHGGDEDRVARWAEGLSFAVEQWLMHDEDDALAVLGEYLDGPPLAGFADTTRRSQLLAASAMGFHRAGKVRKARELNARARELGGGDAWVQLGLFEVEVGNDAGAAEAFAEALRLDPARKDASFFANRLRGGSVEVERGVAGH